MASLQRFFLEKTRLQCYLLTYSLCIFSFSVIAQEKEKTYNDISSHLRTKSQSCIDTSFRKLLKDDSTTQLWSPEIIKSNDGNFYIPAFFTHGASNNSRDGYLIKSSFDGNIIWAKRIIAGYNDMGLLTVLETIDGGLLLVGEIRIPSPSNGRSELALVNLIIQDLYNGSGLINQLISPIQQVVA
jgi:hypothetical protein